jgi:chemotaxis protein CheD
MPIWLPPGLLHTAAAPCVITTLLGSCVAVSLWCSDLRVGGMNHYLLPRAPADAEGSMRYGDTSLLLMHTRLRHLGAGRLVARVFGGASIAQLGVERLGAQNVDIARVWLLERGIPIVAEDVLGARARRVQLDLDTGETRVSRVGSS